MGDKITFDDEPQESTETGNQDESTGTENQDESTETESPDEEPTEAKNQEDDNTESEPKPINQEAVNKKINKLTAKRREAETKAEEAQRKLEEAQERIKELEGKSDDIEIPPLPDAYDPEYESKLAERDAAIRKKAEADLAVKQAEKEEQKRLERQQEESRQRYIDQTTKMYQAGEKIGIKKEELQQAEQTLATFINDPALAQYILAHEDSALIVNHLANNVETLDRISRMPGVQASVEIATAILPKAKSFKAPVTDTPDPLDIPTGKKAGSDDPFLKDVKFE